VNAIAKVGRYEGPAPVIHPENEEFYRSLGQGELRLQQCTQCHMVRFPVAPVCYACGSFNFAWVPVPVTGHVSAAITIHRATGDQAWAGAVPFVTAQVDMEGGRRMPGRVFCSCGAATKHGTAVRAAFLDAGSGLGVMCFVHDCPADEEVLPVANPDEGASSAAP
jgi:uncharacterized OB-fold protein